MQAYNVEIFDRNFNYISHQQIERPDIIEDYLAPEEFTATMLNADAHKGDYIRFDDYVGVISEITKGERLMDVSVKPFISLFSIEFLFDTDYQGSGTSLEAFLKLTIDDLFVNNTDAEQAIPGLTVATTSSTAGWGFHITSTEEGQHRAIINLYDSIISRACEKYQVTLRPTFDFHNKTVTLEVGTVSGGKTIEADLPNVLTKSVTETTSENAVNKLIVYDSNGYTQAVTYYLHTDGTYDGTDADRITPVVLEVKATAAEEDGKTFAQMAADVAAETFGQSEYRDLIELTVTKDDTLVTPLSLQFGQLCTIIADGKSYTTMLTGREITETVKLTFGIVRVDLTKKIASSVSNVIMSSPEIKQIKATAINAVTKDAVGYSTGTITLSGASGEVSVQRIGNTLIVGFDIGSFTVSNAYTWTDVFEVDLSAVGANNGVYGSSKGFAYISGGGPFYDTPGTCIACVSTTGTRARFQCQVAAAVSGRYYRGMIMCRLR